MMSLTCTCSIHGSTSRLDSSSVGRINPCSLDNEMQTEAIWASKRQTADSCFGLVGPHQRRVCLVALRRPRVTYSKANSNGQGRGNETTLAPSHGKNVCAEQTKQTADSCFGLVGPHQHVRTLYVFCSQKVASTHKKCFATSSRVTPRGGRRHVITLRRIHTTNLYMYMFCLTFPLLKQCESTVRRDVTGSYIMLLKGNGTRAARKLTCSFMIISMWTNLCRINVQ